MFSRLSAAFDPNTKLKTTKKPGTVPTNVFTAPLGGFIVLPVRLVRSR